MAECPNCSASNVDDANFCSRCGAPILVVAMVPASSAAIYSSTPITVPCFTGFWMRLAALLVDGIVLGVIRFPLMLAFWMLSDDFALYGGLKRGASNPGLSTLYTLINLVLTFGYLIIMTGSFQATVGKMALGLKVVGTDMKPVSYGTAALREFSKILSSIPCLAGFIWAGYDPRKQAWHDKIAKTYVINYRDA